jgi:hypothetical protein
VSDRDPFDRLAAAARREPVPGVDVAERVLRTIAAPPLRSDRLFLWLALGSAAAAAACAVVALPAWEALSDPLAQVMIAIQGVAP